MSGEGEGGGQQAASRLIIGVGVILGAENDMRPIT